MKDIIYLDNNATTRILDQVWNEMYPYFIQNYANASSIYHPMGREANAAVEVARTQVATALHCSTKEVFFNSGSTESINTVLRGVFEKYRSKGKHIITAVTEHKAVLSCCDQLSQQGALITYLPVDAQGQISTADLQAAITPETILVCLMAANNETGVLSPIDEIATICKREDILFFCDATQAVGKVILDLQSTPIDMLCLSAHKIHGPKGIGALFIRRKSKPIQLSPLIVGGGQEQSFRGGTYNVPAIVGLGKAMASVTPNIYSGVRDLRDLLETSLGEIPEIIIHGSCAARLPTTSYISFRHILASEIMTACPDLALSSGAACVTGSREPSHVLTAMGLSKEDALSAIRFSLSILTTREEIIQCTELIKAAVKKIRAQSPIWQLHQAGLLS
ncbi:cysteine desulfurase family protein [Sphingobacterium thalpophilum]|uniref:cysteine desulfurase n=1 Tax=Sphingobacterium thalpophilum TaxID=259 RepID=A0A4U9W6T9_9SPHI|nr:cysteine desulfurase family protein [Sphingobacterium thalpophilum]VTR54555.1 Cysteine desulfurase [Sphingobacterium thalpophilum]